MHALALPELALHEFALPVFVSFNGLEVLESPQIIKTGAISNSSKSLSRKMPQIQNCSVRNGNFWAQLITLYKGIMHICILQQCMPFVHFIVLQCRCWTSISHFSFSSYYAFPKELSTNQDKEENICSWKKGGRANVVRPGSMKYFLSVMLKSCLKTMLCQCRLKYLIL